jgi:hypothetical protein
MSEQTHPFEPAHQCPWCERGHLPYQIAAKCVGAQRRGRPARCRRLTRRLEDFPVTGHDTDPAAGGGFDQMTEDGITAYAEEMAKQICPDDQAKQNLIVEALRNMMRGRPMPPLPSPADMQKMTQAMVSGMAPGLQSPNRFFISVKPITIHTPEGDQPVPGPASSIEIIDFFNLFQTSWKLEIVTAVHPSGPRIRVHRNGGFATMLDPPASNAFIEFLRPYGFIQ